MLCDPFILVFVLCICCFDLMQLYILSFLWFYFWGKVKIFFLVNRCKVLLLLTFFNYRFVVVCCRK